MAVIPALRCLKIAGRSSRPAGINPQSRCFETDTITSRQQGENHVEHQDHACYACARSSICLRRTRVRRQDEGNPRRQGRGPPNTSAGKGTADLDYDPASKKLSWKLTYSGLSGPPTAAHFHGPAAAGANAGVAVAIPNAGSSPVEGSATLTDAQAADLMAGKYYINVHTAANPGGEIRGQVTK